MTQKVAEYELYKRIKLLGEGAFGKAYLVEFLQDKSIWVIKYMDMTTMSAAEKEETLREAKILELLKHPNIVKFKEVYKTKKGKLCIVMEYADGADLAKRIKDQRGQYFPETQILDWFTQICLALKHVHDRKIIHRDLKGQNIFLTKDNRVKLGDFGIARVLKKTMEKAKTMVGTPYYISPEIIEGRPYSLMTDIWSIGVVLYELCTLKPPFNAESLHFLALKIVKGQYTPIPSHYSKELKSLVASLLQIDPRRRPSIQDILKMPVVVNRIKGFLTESIRNQEFSHTILHRQVFEPKANLNQVRVINKEMPCPPELLQQNIRDLQENVLPQLVKAEIKPPTQQPLSQPHSQPQAQPQQQQKPSSVPNNGVRSQPNQVLHRYRQSQFVSPPDQKQIKSQPSQFEPRAIVAAAKPPNPLPNNIMRPPVLQQNPSRPPLLQDPSKPSLQKIESKEQLNNNHNKPSRPQSNYGQPPQVVTPPSQPKPTPKQQQVAQRPQSSNQQQKALQVEQPKAANDKRVVVKSPMQKQRPASEYRLNEPKKDANPDKDRIDQRIKNLKAKEQKLKDQQQLDQQKKDQQQLDQQRKQALLEQQRKDEDRREEQRREEVRKRRNEAAAIRDEEVQKLQDEANRRDQQKENRKEQNAQVQKAQPKPSSKALLVENNQIDQNAKQSQKSEVEKNQEREQMLLELEEVINNVKNVVGGLPEQEEKNYFDIQTQMIPKGAIPEDRDDDSDEPDVVDEDVKVQLREKQERDKRYEMSKEDQECLATMHDKQKFSTLKKTLVGALGNENFDKAVAVLQQLIDQNELEDIEQRYGKQRGYKDVLPFLNDQQRKHVPLLLTHIITGKAFPS